MKLIVVFLLSTCSGSTAAQSHGAIRGARRAQKQTLSTLSLKHANSSAKLCGRPASELPPMFMINLESRPDRLEFVKERTAAPIFHNLQIQHGFDIRSHSREGLRDVMKLHNWHPFPSFGNLQNLKNANAEVEKVEMRDKILHRCLGVRDGEEGGSTSCDGDSFNSFYYDRDETLGEMGSMISHLSVWQQLVEHSTSVGWAIVLEDDVAIPHETDLCNFINEVEAFEKKADDKFAWDFINVQPCGNLDSLSVFENFNSDSTFMRVRSSMCTSFYAISIEYAKYLEAAHPENCLRALDDFTTFACDPASQPMREAFGACWSELKERRNCFNWGGEAFSIKAEGEVAKSDNEAQSAKTAQDEKEMAWLREELGTDKRIENPFSREVTDQN